MIQAVLTGNLGRDPEIKETRNGKSMANLSVASTTKRSDRDPETTWVDVVCFDELALGAAGSLRKGQKVVVTGSLVMETFRRKDGSEGTALRMVASDIGSNVRAAKQAASSVDEPW